MTLESYIQSLKATAPKNRNSSVDNIRGTSPLIGTVKIPVLLVKFSNSGSTISQSTINTKFNSPTITQSSISVSKYFYKQSYGNLNLIYDVYNWTTMPHAFTYYSANYDTVSYLITDAMAAFDSTVDFSQYDADSDGRLDGIIIIFSGDQGLYPSGIPAQTRILKNYYSNSVDGKHLGNSAIVSEKYNGNSDYIDVIVHEFAHILGLPDLYENSPTFSNLGPMENMSMMTSDHTGNSTCRKKPSNLDAWSRYFFGWTNPIILTTDGNKQISLRSANDFPDSVILKNSYMTNREFFIIENRYRENVPSNLDKCMFNNAAATYGGFAIYHVDENKIEYHYPNNWVNWDPDGNWRDDTVSHPGIMYEENYISNTNYIANPADFYFNEQLQGCDSFRFFDENMRICTNIYAIDDATTRAYSGVANPFIRFEALSSTNQPIMTAKMLVGEETITPIANPASGNYTNPISVTLTSTTPNATIYYTLDGTEPTINSQIYSQPINISQTTTLKAIAKKNNFYVSDVLIENYTITQTTSAPLANIPSGNYPRWTQIELSTTTPNSNIYYTMDSTTPDQSSTLYQSPIIIDHNFTLKAIAYSSGNSPSQVSTYYYTTNDIPEVAEPIANIAGGTYSSTQVVELTSPTPNTIIRYTLDGTEPNRINSLYYNGSITISQNTTLKAKAYLYTGPTVLSSQGGSKSGSTALLGLSNLSAITVSWYYSPTLIEDYIISRHSKQKETSSKPHPNIAQNK